MKRTSLVWGAFWRQTTVPTKCKLTHDTRYSNASCIVYRKSIFWPVCGGYSNSNKMNCSLEEDTQGLLSLYRRSRRKNVQHSLAWFQSRDFGCMLAIILHAWEEDFDKEIKACRWELWCQKLLSLSLYSLQLNPFWRFHRKENLSEKWKKVSIWKRN